ncbi:MAG TPA: histone deacetylase [Dissulfurispiraceae bacterium]|nr:histone deacetylase [Dissulfurispiraceae bacterium]
MRAKNRLGVIVFPAFDWAISPTHPERQERLLYTQDQLREEGIFDIPGITEYKPDIASAEDMSRVHFCIPDVAGVTTESHRISAGGAVRAGRLVMEGRTDKAFALVRPPGHHAMKVVHGNRGFCNINIEAVMIEHIREHYGQKRIAIVDTDCHHGDGTQDIYWHDPNTLFISLHQDGKTLHPGSGHIEELGGPNAYGKTINIPLPPMTGDEGFLHVVDNIVLPILNDFRPDLIINSAGQDNHYSDPITNMMFTARGYAQLNEKLNPDIAVLEGGYSIQGALPYVNCGIVLAMAGLDYSFLHEPDYDAQQLRQELRVTAQIRRTTDAVLENYFHPKPHKNYEPGSFVSRRKRIFYDTDMISDEQVESVMRCDECAGLIIIESVSSINPPALCIEIPLGACARCREAGVERHEQELTCGRYRILQLINRPEKIYGNP